MSDGADRDLESVQSFTERARDWVASNLTPISELTSPGSDASGGNRSEADWRHARSLQAQLHAGGFAGICYPKQYGGLGLTPAHQRAFNKAVAGYEMPVLLNTPTFTICCPTILDMGSEEQKRAHLAAAIRGEEILVQFLSEPRSGSDLAGATTRATRDGDTFVLNGSKIWSSGAYAADYALCLARTDWAVPKHQGLTMFLLQIRQPGIQIRRIRQVDGGSEFCQEFFDNVRVPLSAVIGEVNGGWAVASRQLFHERNAMGGGSPYVSGPGMTSRHASPTGDLIELVRRSGQAGDLSARELVAEFHALGRMQSQLVDRITAGMLSNQLPSTAGSLIRLFSAESTTRRAEIALELAGPGAVMSDPSRSGEPDIGVNFLVRQQGSIGGGTTEMARNIISERVLGMPREYAADRDVPFSQVRTGR